MALSPEKIEEIKSQLQGLSPEEQQKKLQEILASLPPEEREQLTGGQQQCPFCLMVEGQIPVRKVYEDDTCMAILDINPANKGHTLLFPKKHYHLMAEMDDHDVSHIFKIANKLSVAIFEALGAQGTNILVANGPAAGQAAPHVLVNVIPRFQGDKVSIGWEPKKLTDEEMENTMNKIASKAAFISSKPDIIIQQAAPIEENEGQSPRDFSRIP